MTFRIVLRAATLAVGLGLGAQAFAADSLAPAQAARLADTVTAANTDPAYRAILGAERDALVATLRAGVGDPLTQSRIETVRQKPPMVDEAWLKAAAYDFDVKGNQDAGIQILMPFLTLPRWQLQRNDMTTAEINLQASADQQAHAIFDAYAIAFLYFIPEALGPKLGRAFLEAYKAGEIGKTAALLKASEISTGAAKAYFNYRRPFLIDGNAIQLVPDRSVGQTGVPYTGAGGAFPSGHTNTGYTDGLLLAEMLPERFTALIGRAAGYGYSRVVLGVHYPLDVIGSRMIVERNVARFLADPAYKALFDEARDQLRAALEKRCGTALAECAKPGDARSDPWAAAAMGDFYRFTMTYDLPRSGPAGTEMQVPEGAEILLAPLAPNASAEARRDILKRTALGSGYPLDPSDPRSGYWQRLDLYAAALAVHAAR